MGVRLVEEGPVLAVLVREGPAGVSLIVTYKVMKLMNRLMRGIVSCLMKKMMLHLLLSLVNQEFTLTDYCCEGT